MKNCKGISTVEIAAAIIIVGILFAIIYTGLTTVHIGDRVCIQGVQNSDGVVVGINQIRSSDSSNVSVMLDDGRVIPNVSRSMLIKK